MTRIFGFVVLLTASVGVCVALGQKPDVPQDDGGKKADKGKPYYYSAKQCGGPCHGLAAPLDDKDLPALCRCTESTIWQGDKARGYKGDKHADAFAVLSGPTAQRMGELLGLKPETDARCVSCHGVVVEDEGRQRSKLFDPKAEGINCSVCHGPSRAWFDVHGTRDLEKREEWRKKSRAEKDEKWGMTDLWDPAKRTQLCASCHVGDLSQGKFVTHAMYAAGHPPLPSFEVAAFSDEMRHWQYLSEKPERVQKDLGYAKNQHERAALVAVGNVVTFETAMRLLRDGAREAERTRTGLDFALFDCGACHHDLRSKSWRQERGYDGVPGRPRPHEWPMSLLGPSVRLANVKEEATRLSDLRALATRLRASFDRQPFGAPAEVAPLAEALHAWAVTLRRAPGLQEAKIDADAAKELVKALVNLPTKTVPDYDSARLRAWSLLAVKGEASGLGSTVPDLKNLLRLELPSGRQRHLMKELGDALKVRANYDPKEFGDLMELVAQRVR